MVARIIGGLFAAGIGFLMVWKSQFFTETFGSLSYWADSHLGGVRNVYRILGCIVIFIAFLVITNLHVAFFRAIFGGLFPNA